MSTTNKVPISASSSYTTDAPFAQTLRTALVANNSIPTIQESLHNELQRTGWSTNLRLYITNLMRSGECTNYDELMERVLRESVGGEEGGAGGKKGEKGGEKERGEGKKGLRIPESVTEKGVKVVAREIAKVVDFEGEEGES